MKDQIELLSQLHLYGKFSLTPTSYLVGYEEYHFDEQNNWKKNIILILL